MIYFIVQDNYIKVGLSSDPEKRLTQLQVGSPSKLRLWLCLPGDKAIETAIHDYFKPHHAHGEWYEFRDSLKYAVEQWVHNGGITPVEYPPWNREIADLVFLTGEERDLVDRDEFASLGESSQAIRWDILSGFAQPVDERRI